MNKTDLLELSQNPEASPEVRQYAYASLGIDMRYGILPEEEYSVVPEGHYFMLGDNSLQSLDSRVWGFVPFDHLYGRTFAIWWPFNHMRDFTGFSHTWWGKGLLIGIPALLILFELRNYLVERKRRRGAAKA